MNIVIRLVLCLSVLIPSFIASAQKVPIFVFVKITESIMPVERGIKYEDPLGDALKNAKLGEVTGGGSLTSKVGKVEWVGIDVDLVNLEQGIPFLRRQLVALGAPKGSTLEYQFEGKKMQLLVHSEAK